VVEGLLAVLEKSMAPRVNIHGNLISVHGLGVLVFGKSGVGKSECALDLVIRGHQLVADDMVYIWRNNSGQLRGRGSELLRYHMEIRGMGIINVRDLFSLTSVLDEHRVEFGIYLEPWDPNWAYQCLGLETEKIGILGVQVPLLRLPVAPGRTLANLIEVAARNYRLRSWGTDSALKMTTKLQEIMEEKRRG